MVEKKELPFEIKEHKYCENPKVSVIVPVYKVDRYLTQCLNSIVNQTMEELEIIIVDEGDQDRCREIIDYFEAHDPRIVAPHQKNGGYGASCNLGFDMARGEYIAIIESDDWIEPEMFEEMYAYAEALDADMVKTPFWDYFSDGRRFDCWHRRLAQEQLPAFQTFATKEFPMLLRIHPSLWSCLYKTTYVRETNLRFVQAKGGAYVDQKFRVDSLVATEKIAWLDKPYYNYRVDSADSTANNFKFSSMLQRWKELHEEYDNPEFYRHYLPALLEEEHRACLGRIWNVKATDKELEAIQYNLQFIPQEAIEQSRTLPEDMRRDLLALKRNPARHFKKAQAHMKLVRVKDAAGRFAERCTNPTLIFELFVAFLMFFFITTVGSSGLVIPVFSSGVIQICSFVLACIS
ncbi:MAG: glycosyltransferase family 2 protein, partial [Ruminococcaceae bacterium]|nr:glycosyltransferase family 2 protein [Oscillospiraceae bacterium]